MKKILAGITALVLLVVFASCGKETAAPAESQTQPRPSETISAPEEMRTTAEEDGSTTAPETTSGFDAETGTFTISGVEEFQMPDDTDLSQIRKIIISDDVLSVKLYSGQNTYSRLETIQCSPDCKVSVSSSDISESPFYQNSENWTDGILYIGSSIIAINEDAPAVCRLKNTLFSIDWDVKSDLAETAPQIERFEIAEENENYRTDKNGILYECSDDSMRIALYPPASPVETYDVPDAVTSMDVPRAKYLKTIHISAQSSLGDVQSVTENSTVAENSTAISAYRVDPGHPYLFSKDGVLFKKETEDHAARTVLLDYPRNKTAKEYRIPAGTDQVAYGAFAYCPHLETLYIPASLSDFGYSEGFFPAFIGSEKLAHVYVDQGNEVYSSTKDGLFVEGDVMIYLPGRTEKQFTIPSGITGFEAYGNDHIETIALGKDVERFSLDACPAVKSFRAEGNKHGYYTKDGVLYQKRQDWEDPEKENIYLIYYPAGRKDAKFTVPDGVTHLYGAGEWSSDSAFHNNPYIEEITLPESVTMIWCGAFADCISLKKVILPDTLKNLGDSAFYGCTALKEITIPTSLEALGYYDGICGHALSGSSITDIYYKGTRAQWDALVSVCPTELPSGVRVHCTDD